MHGSNRSPIDWPAVLRRHDRWLRTILFARLRCADAVDEVIQEIALAVMRQSALPTDSAKVPPWLYQVAVRQAVLYRRRKGRGRRIARRYASAVPAAPEPSTLNPLQWLLADERRAQVRRALDKLPAREAEMLLLKYNDSGEIALRRI